MELSEWEKVDAYAPVKKLEFFGFTSSKRSLDASISGSMDSKGGPIYD